MADTNQPQGEDAPIPLTPVPEENVPTARLAGGKPSEPKAKIEKPGLISDFPEDADFDKDPAVEFERKGAAAVVRIHDQDDEPTDGRPDFVRPFIDGLPLGEAKFWAIGACALLGGAAILVAI